MIRNKYTLLVLSSVSVVHFIFPTLEWSLME